MKDFCISIFLGVIPEVTFFILCIIYMKNIKTKRIQLIILMSLAYILCINIIRLQVLFYIVFILLVYIILKILYKEDTQKIDIFAISFPASYITILSLLVLFMNEDYSNYWTLAIINKVLLFVPLIFRKKFNKLYERYKHLWNRNDKMERKIKSITLRNFSVVILNILIFSINFIGAYIVEVFSK